MAVGVVEASKHEVFVLVQDAAAFYDLMKSQQ